MPLPRVPPRLGGHRPRMFHAARPPSAAEAWVPAPPVANPGPPPEPLDFRVKGSRASESPVLAASAVPRARHFRGRSPGPGAASLRRSGPGTTRSARPPPAPAPSPGEQRPAPLPARPRPRIAVTGPYPPPPPPCPRPAADRALGLSGPWSVSSPLRPLLPLHRRPPPPRLGPLLGWAPSQPLPARPPPHPPGAARHLARAPSGEPHPSTSASLAGSGLPTFPSSHAHARVGAASLPRAGPSASTSPRGPALFSAPPIPVPVPVPLPVPVRPPTFLPPRLRPARTLPHLDAATEPSPLPPPLSPLPPPP